MHRRKRSKATILLLAPFIAIVYLVGLFLYVLGQKQNPLPKKSPVNPAKVEFIIIPIKQN